MAHQADGVAEAEALGGDQRGVFAQAVAGHEIGDKAALAEHGPGGHGDRQQRGLLVLGELELIVGTFKTEARNGEAECIVGFFKRAPRHGKPIGKRLTHAGVLRPLARKKESGFRCQKGL